MSQRNPMNARYTGDEHKGASRRSAASAKPKAQAASTVTVKSAKKTDAEKKAERKAAQKAADAKQRELDRKYYTPNTVAYKKYRRMWWGCLVLAILCVALAWVFQNSLSTAVSMVVMVLAYVFIIAAFVIDFRKIRREREKYQKEMVALEESESKRAKAEARRAKTKAAAKAAGAEAEDKKEA